MSKNSVINIRLSEDEKEKAVKVVELLGYKNISTMLRDYINFAFNELSIAPSDFTSLDYYIARLYDEKRNSKCEPYQLYEYNRKIRLLEQLKNEFKDS